MSTSSKSSRERARQLLEIARRYYLGDESMVAISEQLGISRFKVARLLHEARETGVVTITLNTGGDEDPELAKQLVERLGLRRAVVVKAYGTVEEVRRIVGVAAGRHVSGTLRQGETLGLAWGRTLTYMIESLDRLPDIQVLQLNGSVGSDLSQSPIELVRRAALLGGNKARALMAPLYIDDLQAAEALRRQPDLKEVFDLYETVTTAVVAVGGLQSQAEGVNNSQFLPLLPPSAREELLAAGAVAEVCGIPFCEDGSLANTPIVEHILAISPEQLRRVPRVIAIASHRSKADAILAIWRADLISELVVDDDLAEALLSAQSRSGRAVE
jgi:DNA-binding transcriptional regulator LsrR (DeoR family)